MRTHRVKLTIPHTPLGSADRRGTGVEHGVHVPRASGEAHGRSADEVEPAIKIRELRAGLAEEEPLAPERGGGLPTFNLYYITGDRVPGPWGPHFFKTPPSLRQPALVHGAGGLF